LRKPGLGVRVGDYPASVGKAIDVLDKLDRQGCEIRPHTVPVRVWYGLEILRHGPRRRVMHSGVGDRRLGTFLTGCASTGSREWLISFVLNRMCVVANR